ncbi:hypothetical protein D8M09_07155 [Enterobacter sp. R1(2018)]|nr:hypothetical protein D8M09_07155 [Enterobacter sp. R1(2018)]
MVSRINAGFSWRFLCPNVLISLIRFLMMNLFLAYLTMRNLYRMISILKTQMRLLNLAIL